MGVQHQRSSLDVSQIAVVQKCLHGLHPDAAQFLYGLDRIPDKLLTVTLGLFQHLVVRGRDPVTNRSGIQAIHWINRDNRGAAPSRFGVEAGWTVSVAENPELKVGVAQSEHARIFLEGRTPGNYLVGCEHCSLRFTRVGSHRDSRSQRTSESSRRLQSQITANWLAPV